MKLLTLDQVCEELQISIATVRRLISRAEFAVIEVGNQLRVNPSDLDEYIRRKRRPSSDETTIEQRQRLEAMGVRLPLRRLRKPG